MKKILLIADANSMYIHELIRAMHQYASDIQVDVLSIAEVKRSPNLANYVYKQSFYFFIRHLGRNKFLSWILQQIKVLYKKFQKEKNYEVKSNSPVNHIHSSIFWYISLWLRIVMTRMTINNILKHKKHYDVIQIHYIGVPFYTLNIYSSLKKIGEKVALFFWGSDLLRIHPKSIQPMNKLISCADQVFFYVPKQVEKMQSFRQDQPMPEINFIRFGLTILEKIKEMSLISKDNLLKILNLKSTKNTIYITLGHNGSKSLQHLKIIKALQNSVFNHIEFLLPMTYDTSESYRNEVCQLLEKSNFKYHLFSEFMSNKQVVALRLLTDIFIQCLETDALSGAMLEHLYAGSIVITGSWLKYKILVDSGVEFKSIENIPQIKIVLNETLNEINKEKFKVQNNREKIWELASWERRINDWLEI